MSEPLVCPSVLSFPPVPPVSAVQAAVSASECTGAQAGLSGRDQIRLMMEALVSHGGSATMAVLYDAVERGMSPHKLSSTGRAAVRCYMNRTCVHDGLVEAVTVARQTATWRITPKGIALVQPVAVPMPRPRTFAGDLLRALGKLSGHTLKALPALDAIRAILEEAGHDPDNLPHGWGDATSNGRPKIHESLRWQARSMSTLVCFPERGHWALTPLGLERAAKLNGVSLMPQAMVPPVKKKTTGPNVTSKWFTKHLTPAKGEAESELMRMMKGALIKHLPLSARRDLIEDHIQNFMVRVIRRDSFATMIASGEEIPYSKVASYCVNSGRSDARDMGTEPVCREMMGARTDKERHQAAEEDTDLMDGPMIPLDTDGNVALPSELPPVQEENADFETVWNRIVGTVQDHKPGAWERYTNLLRLKALGYTTKEIAKQEGVSRHRAAKMLANARQILRDTFDESVFATV